MFAIVATTCDSKQTAEKIASRVLDQRLAACVQISDTIVSHYRWKGEIVQDTEFLVTMKTRTAYFSQLVALIEQHHTYQVPEIISTDLSNISTKYGLWLAQETDQENNHGISQKNTW